MVKEFYQHREDKLYSRIHNHRSGWVTEFFHEGRSHCLKGEFSALVCVSEGCSSIAAAFKKFFFNGNKFDTDCITCLCFRIIIFSFSVCLCILLSFHNLKWYET